MTVYNAPYSTPCRRAGAKAGHDRRRLRAAFAGWRRLAGAGPEPPRADLLLPEAVARWAGRVLWRRRLWRLVQLALAAWCVWTQRAVPVRFGAVWGGWGAAEPRSELL